MDRKNPNQTKHKSRVFIVDDHPVVRKGLAYVINESPDLVVCGECESAAGVLPGIAKDNPDIVILDIFLKDSIGIDLIKDIHKEHSKLPVLVLSMQEESLYAERALRAGARGYLNKEEMLDQVVSAVRKILNGDVVASEAVKTKILKMFSKTGDTGDPLMDRLSDRELQVFQLLGQGFTTRRIADRWNRSVKTIETYRAQIKRKLQLESGADLVHRAVEWMNSRKPS